MYSIFYLIFWKFKFSEFQIPFSRIRSKFFFSDGRFHEHMMAKAIFDVDGRPSIEVLPSGKIGQFPS